MTTSEEPIPDLQVLGRESMSTINSSELSLPSLVKKASFERSKCSFLRVSDLEMDNGASSSVDPGMQGDLIPNYHVAASDPPPSIEANDNEKWIILNDGNGSYSPIAPAVVEKLLKFAEETTLADQMWTTDKKTEKIFKKASSDDWIQNTFDNGLVNLTSGPNRHEQDILVWSGHFQNNYYGSELPAIRVAGIVNMAPRDLMELLTDSTRTKEYNKMSLGREDLVTFQTSLTEEGPFGKCIAKVFKSTTKPPLVRKLMVLVNCSFAKDLGDDGYIIVSRAVIHPDNATPQPKVIQSEMLLGVNLIRKIDGEPDKCVMINVNHIRSPMIPMVVAKKLGISAAIGFFNDVRNCKS